MTVVTRPMMTLARWTTRASSTTTTRGVRRPSASRRARTTCVLTIEIFPRVSRGGGAMMVDGCARGDARERAWTVSREGNGTDYLRDTDGWVFSVARAQVTALLGSPGFFNFCASSLSPIAMTTRGVRARAGEDGDGDDDGRGRGAGFNSPSMRCARGDRRADAGEGGRWARWARGRWAGAAGDGGGDARGGDDARVDGGRSWRRRETRERGGADGHERERVTMSNDNGARSERGVEKRSERGMSAVERLALSAEASLRRGGAAGDGSGERASYGRKQVRNEFMCAIHARDGARSRRARVHCA